MIRSDHDLISLFEHDFFGKPVPTFPDHALKIRPPLPDRRLLDVGDVLFNGSVGRSDIPGGSHSTLIKSIKDKLLPLGDDVAFICGHGPGSSIGHERLTNPFLTGAM